MVAQLGAKVVAASVATVVLGGTAFAWSAETGIESGFNRAGNEVMQGVERSKGSDINFLLIGLDTRKDQNGNDLPKAILNQLHAGDGQEGGYNANSLILVHIPADRHNIIAFSIPRDDYVPVSGIRGYDHAKIKESYGLKKAEVQNKLAVQGMTDQAKLEHMGRDAGRASIVQTVYNLVGVPIDRFAEISLSGFYDLATALGGVDVCLNHAVNDKFYSGAVFPAGRQHLNGSQALSFVRQRHGLDNGDLDRTHRQQAFLTSVAKQLKDAGTLTDPEKMGNVMDAAHRDVVLSPGWSLIDFIKDVGSAGKVSVEFRTLPVLRYDQVDGQDVNIIDPAAIRKQVRSAFGMDQAAAAAPKTAPTSTVDVYNASGMPGMAGTVSNALLTQGYKKGSVGNASPSDGSSSVVMYGSGADADAKQLAATLGGISVSSSESVPAGHVKVVLGSDFSLPNGFSAAADEATTAAAPAQDSGGPDSGKPVATTIGDTIPCVN